MTAVEIVDAEVRELVRRRGVDPMREPATVRQLVDEVLADYADRALAGALPVVADPAATARAVFDSVAGLGPLQRYLDDPDVEEIWINGPGRVFVARRGRSELTTAILSAEQIRELVERKQTDGRPTWFMYDTYFGASAGLRQFKQWVGFAPYRVSWSWRS